VEFHVVKPGEVGTLPPHVKLRTAPPLTAARVVPPQEGAELRELLDRLEKMEQQLQELSRRLPEPAGDAPARIPTSDVAPAETPGDESAEF
jgi:hypothetical protein